MQKTRDNHLAPTITPLFVALFLFFQVVITNIVGYRRLKTDIHFLDGGDITLMWRRAGFCTGPH